MAPTPYVWKGPLPHTGAIKHNKTRDITPSIGTEIFDLDLVQALNSPNRDEIFQDLAVTISERGVCCFRNQHLDAETHKQVMNAIGKASRRPPENSNMKWPLAPIYGDDLEVVTLIPERVAARYGWSPFDTNKRQNIANEWHSDLAFEENPSDYSSLRLELIPPCGGDTLFASMYDLYDRLSVPFQKFFETLETQWGDDHYTAAVNQEGTYRGPRGSPANTGFTFDAVSPLVRTNPVTGWKAVFGGGVHCKGIKDVTPEESQRIMTMIEDLVIRNHDIQARVRWNEPGDIAIWDNRAVKHIATRDVVGKGVRKGYRVVSIGEKAFFDPNSMGRQDYLDKVEKESKAKSNGVKMETGQNGIKAVDHVNGQSNGVAAH